MLDETGKILRQASAEYPVSVPRPMWSEQMASPFRFGGSDPVPIRPAPLHGEHSLEVFQEFLDLSEEEFASVASDIPPIIPRYDMHEARSDGLNQKWTEMIVG